MSTTIEEIKSRIVHDPLWIQKNWFFTGIDLLEKNNWFKYNSDFTFLKLFDLMIKAKNIVYAILSSI